MTETRVSLGLISGEQNKRSRRMERGIIGTAHRIATDPQIEGGRCNAERVSCHLDFGLRVSSNVLVRHT
jgi:hypothetical protein